MVKKHHAWRVTEPDVYLYGEDIYGVHSIAYEPVAEERTFYAFALRRPGGAFAAFTEVEAYAKRRGIPVVPVLFRGCFGSVAEIRTFLDHAHGEPSLLGGERGRRLAAGTRFFSVRVSGQRPQERAPGARADRRTLDPKLEAVPNRGPGKFGRRSECSVSTGPRGLPHGLRSRGPTVQPRCRRHSSQGTVGDLPAVRREPPRIDAGRRIQARMAE